MKLSDLKVGDIIYFRKYIHGDGDKWMVDLECKFLGMHLGLIEGEVISVDPEWAKSKWKGIQTSFRKNTYIKQDRKYNDNNIGKNVCWWLNPKTNTFE